MKTELEYLDLLDGWLAVVFDAAVDARDKAQAALEETNQIKHRLTERRIEILRAVPPATRE